MLTEEGFEIHKVTAPTPGSASLNEGALESKLANVVAAAAKRSSFRASVSEDWMTVGLGDAERTRDRTGEA